MNWTEEAPLCSVSAPIMLWVSVMKARLISSSLAFSLVSCGGTTPPASAPPEPPAAAPAAEEEAEAEPTEEELAAEKAAEKLAEDRAQMQGHAQIEMRRWTPELREKSKALAEAKYSDLKAAVTAALAGEHRLPQSKERDAARHPLETLSFFGLTPKMRVLEYGPGEGWYTEVLAPTLASQGELFVTTADPNGPKESRQTFYAERLSLFLGKSKEVYGKVKPLVFDPENPALTLEQPLDMALVIRGFHGWVMQGKVDAWLDALHAALKPDGILGIVQHRAPEGADPIQTAPKGYVPEAWLISQVEAHGFKLEAKSEINKNEKDTKDYPEGVWALPPSFRLGEKDRAKYAEIGESDRMTLRFKKVTPDKKN